MALTFINRDGGRIPPTVTAPTASQLLADYNALTTDARAAFRLAIAPQNYSVDVPGDVTGHADAVPGDTASIPDNSDSLLLLLVPPASDGRSWMDILSGEPADEGDGSPRPLEVDGPGNLVAVWRGMSPAQRAAFRLAIKPAFTNVSDEAGRLALANQVPGDYCRQTDAGLFRLRVLPASVDANWDELHLF